MQKIIADNRNRCKWTTVLTYNSATVRPGSSENITARTHSNYST